MKYLMLDYGGKMELKTKLRIITLSKIVLLLVYLIILARLLKGWWYFILLPILAAIIFLYAYEYGLKIEEKNIKR